MDVECSSDYCGKKSREQTIRSSKQVALLVSKHTSNSKCPHYFETSKT